MVIGTYHSVLPVGPCSVVMRVYACSFIERSCLQEVPALLGIEHVCAAFWPPVAKAAQLAALFSASWVFLASGQEGVLL